MSEITLNNIELGDKGSDSRNKINNNAVVLKNAINSLDTATLKKTDVVQTLGTTTNKVPSEKAISDTLANYPKKNEVLLGTILKGNKTNVAEIKAVSNPKGGDTYKALDTGHYWTFDGTQWNDIGNVLPDDFAPKADASGNKVVYAKDGVIDLTPFPEKAQLNFSNLPIFSNTVDKFVQSEFITGQYLQNNSGVPVSNSGAKISNWIELPNGTKGLKTNSDRQIVFYDANKNVKSVINSLDQSPAKLTVREISVDTSYKYARVTIVNEHLSLVYCYLTNDGIGSISSENVRYNNKKISEILNGINYGFGSSTTPTSENLFTSSIFIAINERHNDTTGAIISESGYSATTTIPATLIRGTNLVINTNQTVVLKNSAGQVVQLFPSLSSTPSQIERIVSVSVDNAVSFAFTFLTVWGRNTMYAKTTSETIVKLPGIPANSIIFENQLLDSILSNLSAFDKGSEYGMKHQLSFTESPGVTLDDGTVFIPAPAEYFRGTIATSTESLEKNSIYYIEFKEIVSGRISLFIGGIPLIMSGRKSMWFRTDNRDNQKLVIWVQGDTTRDGIPISFDLRGKYKCWRIDEPAMTKSIMKLPSIANDISQYPTAEIPEPKWAIWNIYGNYHKLTMTTDYSSDSVIVEYIDSNGYYFQKYAVVGGQGRTSMTFENHNSKYKLTNLDGSKFVLKIGDWLPRSTFHFKVNFSDFAQLNNPATASFITDWYRDANDPKFFYPWDKETPVDLSKVQLTRLYDRRPRGIIGAIPASIRTYWNHRSCGTMNLNAFAENFFLDSKNLLHRGFRGDTDHSNKWRWEEMCSDTEGEAMTEETWQPFANWYSWIKTNSSTTNLQVFKDGDCVKFDKQNLIDSWLFAELCFLRDNLWANQVWISYNSEKYYYMWYDMDTAFGLSPLGQVDYKPTDDFKPNGSDQYLWTQVKRAYPTEIATRYKELRDSGRFSVAKFREIYGGYQARFNYEWFEMDFYTWLTRKSIKAGSFASLERVLWFVENRLAFLDSKYGYIPTL